MVKKILLAASLITIVAALIFGAVNRTMAKTGSESETVNQGGYGHGQGEVTTSNTRDSFVDGNGVNGTNGRQGQNAGGVEPDHLSSLPPAATAGLTPEETAALLYMREEEKLAYDVYTVLYAQWGFPLFQNISLSEQTHMESVKILLDRYGLGDPAVYEAGVFSNPDLQALYNELTSLGSQSLSEALKVGAAIEEIDILDLQERLAKTDKPDIVQVFNSLLEGAYNHLRSFTSSLTTQTGEIYQPQYLSPEAYQTILSTGTERGGNGSGEGGRGRGRRAGSS